MIFNKTTIERAFELAESGEFNSPDQIRRKLGREGFAPGQIVGPQLSKQLMDVSRKAREAAKRS